MIQQRNWEEPEGWSANSPETTDPGFVTARTLTLPLKLQTFPKS